ncbi:uncharacterized protein ccdc14 isoform X1 [Entelurus aequoreus]|uniref:uncharacterized protein ccdc14 isoform X1 n=1 Tax=Entelurus aequoreus TaxID=161455 RepID=UPI002B1D38D7|nr:uncharacterized protein ccdc14 isoform X1 [Entelurus aequoreus]
MLLSLHHHHLRINSASAHHAALKVLTLGRLAGGGTKVQQARKRVTTTPRQAEPAYSLYSSDPQEQVDSLHSGLDRCAALLTGILQVHKAEPLTGPLKAVKGSAAKPKLSNLVGKKSCRKPLTKTKQYSSMAPEAQCLPAVSHTEVEQAQALIQPHLIKSLRVPHPFPESVLCQFSSSGRPMHAQIDRQQLCSHHQASLNGEEVDAVPVKDRDTQTLSLQKELTFTQSQLQELQVDLAEVKQSLEYTNNQLQEREAENAQIKSDLESIRTKLVHSEQAKSRLASLAQERLEEIENLKRIILNDNNAVVGLSLSDTAPQEQRYDRNAAAEHIITKYLMTLCQLEGSHAGGNVHLATESEGNAPEEANMSSVLPGRGYTHPDCVTCEGVGLSAQPKEKECRRLFDSFLSQRDTNSTSCDCSLRSMSTFDTKDEAAFRDGLAALDASIASLQKTMKLDLLR